MMGKVKTPGPIAAKLIRNIKQLRQRKIIDLNAVRTAKGYLEKMTQSNADYDFSSLDPLHAMYTEIQHRIADFFEQFSSLSYSHKFCSNHEIADDIYMPMGPPISPITKSFYTCWFALDMGIGLKKETIASIMIAFYRALHADQYFINILEIMQASYNSFYTHEGSDERFVYLREIYTGEVHRTLVPAGYKGMPGETWLIRLLPSAFPEIFDYSIAFATPYVIMEIPLNEKKCVRNIILVHMPHQNGWTS